ncbi:hypothetical protein GGD46_004077 [Rhizobium lusitanum]|uniref:Uncharacterized protein n=1 Tax=Rhizobium lusitanum TaxID=293958 RepID=A0A7X0IU54_9HYPH|nr:hypothetical protein [Rhizobium lusitanum]
MKTGLVVTAPPVSESEPVSKDAAWTIDDWESHFEWLSRRTLSNEGETGIRRF